MKFAMMVFLFFLAGCVPNTQKPEKAAMDFYSYYLSNFDKPTEIAYSTPMMRRYIAADTLKKLSFVQDIEEQEINESDYFFYGQDYDPSWISALKVGISSPFLGGVMVPVSIGIEESKHVELSVYMRFEDGLWKIYRVKDETGNYEQPIFDAGRISAAVEHAKSLSPQN